jgi:hypothetical protein
VQRAGGTRRQLLRSARGTGSRRRMETLGWSVGQRMGIASCRCWTASTGRA